MKTLYLFDLDLTLIDTDYRPTIPLDGFTSLVEERTAAGDVFGLISDTPFESLQRWAVQFKFGGPIVSEKGAIVSSQRGEHREVRSQIIGWDVVKAEIRSALRGSLSGVTVVDEYYLDLMTGDSAVQLRPGPLVIINPYRRCSFGLHVCLKNDHGISFNEDLFPEVKLVVKGVLRRLRITDLVKPDVNEVYSVIILSDPAVLKSIAIPVLRKKYSGYRLVAVGDGASDAELKGRVDLLAAVANASDGLISVADYVSQSEITAGALEILQHFSEGGSG